MNNHHNNTNNNQRGYQPPPYTDYQSIAMNDDNNGENSNQSAGADNVVTPMAPPATDEVTTKPNKKASGDEPPPVNNNDNTAPAPHTPDLNLNAPSYQKVERPAGGGTPHGSDPHSNAQTTTAAESNPKTCRICLEDDEQDTMIAPCKCRGYSKWVHRDCLDEWRLNERDRAFSKCTECLFEYYMQPVHKENENSQHRRWRQFRFCWNVSRDVCMGTLLLQLVIVILGAIIFAFDSSNQALPNQVFPAFANHPFALYYLLGWLLLLVFVGIYGSIVLCMNGCDVSRSIPQVRPPVPAAHDPMAAQEMMSGATAEDRLARGVGMESNTEFYRRARHRRQRRHRSYNRRYRDDGTCCESCVYSCNRQPIIIYGPGYHGCCCCHHHTHNVNSDGDCGCCNACGVSGGDGGNQDCGECVHVLLIILLVLAVVLAAIGFVVGMVVAIIAFQRVVQRHIHLIQKRQLIQEYQVMDLQEYDLDMPLPTAPRAEDVELGGVGTSTPGSHPAPSAPLESLPERDVSYLQKLGLMD